MDEIRPARTGDRSYRVEFQDTFGDWVVIKMDEVIPAGHESGRGGTYWYEAHARIAVRERSLKFSNLSYRIVNLCVERVTAYYQGGKEQPKEKSAPLNREEVTGLSHIPSARAMDLRYRVEYKAPEDTEFSLFSRVDKFRDGGELGKGGSFNVLENARHFALVRSMGRPRKFYRVVDLIDRKVVFVFQAGQNLNDNHGEGTTVTVNTEPTKPLIITKETALAKVNEAIAKLEEEHSAAQTALAAENAAKIAKLEKLLANPYYVARLFENAISGLHHYDNAEAVFAAVTHNYGKVPGTAPFEPPEDLAKQKRVLEAIENTEIEITPEHNLYNVL